MTKLFRVLLMGLLFVGAASLPACAGASPDEYNHPRSGPPPIGDPGVPTETGF